MKKDPHSLGLFSWLGNKNVIKTFSDEDLQNVHDIEEIQKLLDDTVDRKVTLNP